MKLGRRKLAPILLVAALALIWLVFGRKAPADQVVHVVLGDRAPRITAIALRYTAEGETEAAREATFRYALGQAPRIVTHEPRLAGGDYMVEIELSEGNDRAEVRRKVKLDGSPVSLDVKESLP